jgi:hypothetical protein
MKFELKIVALLLLVMCVASEQRYKVCNGTLQRLLHRFCADANKVACASLTVTGQQDAKVSDGKCIIYFCFKLFIFNICLAQAPISQFLYMKRYQRFNGGLHTECCSTLDGCTKAFMLQFCCDRRYNHYI